MPTSFCMTAQTRQQPDADCPTIPEGTAQKRTADLAHDKAGFSSAEDMLVPSCCFGRCILSLQPPLNQESER